jgi:hypothetical protein
MTFENIKTELWRQEWSTHAPSEENPDTIQISQEMNETLKSSAK